MYYLIISNNYTLRLNLLNLNVSFQSSVFCPNGGNTILIWMVSICFELVIWWFEVMCMTIVQHLEVLCKVEDHFILLNAKLERHCDVRSKEQESRTIMCQTNCLKYWSWSSWGFFLIYFCWQSIRQKSRVLLYFCQMDCNGPMIMCVHVRRNCLP